MKKSTEVQNLRRTTKLPTMTGTAFASLLGVAPSTVTLWAGAGMPCRQPGRSGAELAITPERALPWIVRRASAKPTSALGRIHEARARRFELQNMIAEGAVVPLAPLRQTVFAAIAHLGQALDSVPARCTPDEGLQQRVETELRLARDRFAELLLTIEPPRAGRAK